MRKKPAGCRRATMNRIGLWPARAHSSVPLGDRGARRLPRPGRVVGGRHANREQIDLRNSEFRAIHLPARRIEPAPRSAACRVERGERLETIGVEPETWGFFLFGFAV